jgi:dihydroflavonol-4-reductase
MNVLITGGTGFIGSHLALACLDKGDGVKVFGQENTEAEKQNRKLLEDRGIGVINASVTNREQVFQAVESMDVVYHLAAVQHEMNVPDQKFWDVNVNGTKNFLEASVKAGVKRFIHGSTIGVYGSALEGTLDENSPVRPDNIYGITKLEGEKMVTSFEGQVPYVIIRISETYGPGDRRLLKLFKAIKKKTFFLIGNGKNIHHPIYIDDLVQGLYLSACVEQAAGQVFVLPGKAPLSTREMVDAIADAVGVKTPRLRAPLWPFLLLATSMELTMRPLGIQPPLHRRRMDFFKKSFLFSQERSARVLGFIPQYDFRQGAAAVANWYVGMDYI